MYTQLYVCLGDLDEFIHSNLYVSSAAYCSTIKSESGLLLGNHRTTTYTRCILSKGKNLSPRGQQDSAKSQATENCRQIVTKLDNSIC